MYFLLILYRRCVCRVQWYSTLVSLLISKAKQMAIRNTINSSSTYLNRIWIEQIDYMHYSTVGKWTRKTICIYGVPNRTITIVIVKTIEITVLFLLNYSKQKNLLYYYYNNSFIVFVTLRNSDKPRITWVKPIIPVP